MPDWKKNWPDLVYKILTAILAIILGVNQYQAVQEHHQFKAELQSIHQCLGKPISLSSNHLVYLNGKKPIKLLELKDESIRDVFKAATEPQYNGIVKPFVPPAVDLGMGNVPVLDQGQEGTCVTFSSTAALDALLNQGDFISQQCSLLLDTALGDDYWNGANAPSEIIAPLQKYGVISKNCCPSQYPDLTAVINLTAYQLLAAKAESAFVANVEFEYFESADINALKLALKQGYRVLIGFHVYAGVAQAVQGFNVNGGIGGLWACSQGGSQNYCINSNSGHEVVVIGYDDSQQLLKIRNSWGPTVGQAGDYFMSYQFFQTMAIDMTVIK